MTKKIVAAAMALSLAAANACAEPADYTATAQGFGGEVSVTITVDGTDITACTVTGDSETAGVGSNAVEQMPEKIVEADTWDVDGVAGATFTSTAVREAAKAAMTEAGLVEAEAAAAFVPGTYTATAHGYTSDITLEVTLSENAIESVNVVDQDETVGIGSYALNSMPGEMVAQQTVMVDMVSGATASSSAIRQAALACLNQAGADLAVFAKDPVVPAPEDAEYDADIVIIGAGAAGLTAAVEALDDGASVIVVEKMDIPGGNTVRSSGDWNVAGHPEQVANNSSRSDVEKFIEYTMTGGHNINNESLVRYMVENSAAITDWTRSIGFETKFNETYTAAQVPGRARGLVTGLKDKMLERGGVLLLSSKVEAITMEDGKAVGVTGTTATGGKLTVHAKAVIDAAGGFGHNLEMVYALKPEYDGFVTNNQVGATGDGIIMAQAIGAATVDMEQIQAHPTVHQATANMLTEGCRTAGAILLNTSGHRFIDECNYRDVVANAILAQDQKFAYMVLNQQIVDSNSNIAGYIKLGILEGPYDSYDAIAEAYGLPADAVKETITNWNSYVAQQNDPEFGSNFLWVRDLSEGPWYVAKVAPGIHHTMGGLKIDTKTQVYDTNGAVIPGLFAAGEVTGGVHGGNRVGGNAILDCLVFGHTAGDQAAEYVK